MQAGRTQSSAVADVSPSIHSKVAVPMHLPLNSRRLASLSPSIHSKVAVPMHLPLHHKWLLCRPQSTAKSPYQCTFRFTTNGFSVALNPQQSRRTNAPSASPQMASLSPSIHSKVAVPMHLPLHHKWLLCFPLLPPVCLSFRWLIAWFACLPVRLYLPPSVSNTHTHTHTHTHTYSGGRGEADR